MECECHVRGNILCRGQGSYAEAKFLKALTCILTLIDKARKVAKRFNIDPVWTVEAFDQDSREAAAELHAIFFEGELIEKMPNATLRFTCVRKSFRRDVLNMMGRGGEHLCFTSTFVYKFFGESLEVGRLTQEYTGVTLKEEKPRGRNGKRAGADVKLVAKGSSETVRITRPGPPLGAVQTEK